MVFQPLKRGETISSVSIFDHPTVQMNHTSVVPTSTFTQLLPEPERRKKLQHNLMNIHSKIIQSAALSGNRKPYLPSIVPRFWPPKLIGLTSHINLPRFDPRAGIHPRANIKAIHLSAWLSDLKVLGGV